MRMLPIIGLVLAAIFTAACQTPEVARTTESPGTGANSSAASPASAPSPAPVATDATELRSDEELGLQDNFAGTAGITEKRRGTENSALLKNVRFGGHGGFDRAVFEFADVLPSYHIEYVDRPVYSCGAGEPVPVQGDGWLLVRFDRTNAHTEQGEPTVSGTARPGLAILKEAKMICDFEADVQWVLGVSSPNKYRVLELKDPARIVVDIKQ